MNTSMHPSYIVEFVGGPASGKTTVASALLSHLETQGYVLDVYTRRLVTEATSPYFATRSRLIKYLHYVRSFVAVLPKLSALVSLFISLTHKTRRDWKQLRSFAKMIVAVDALNRHLRGGDFLLLDRGFINAVVSLFDSHTIETHRIRPLLQRLYADMQVNFILLDISPKVAVERAHARAPKGDYIETLSPESALLEYKARQARIDKIFKVFISESTSMYVRIDGESSIEKKVSEIAGFLLSQKLRTH